MQCLDQICVFHCILAVSFLDLLVWMWVTMQEGASLVEMNWTPEFRKYTGLGLGKDLGDHHVLNFAQKSCAHCGLLPVIFPTSRSMKTSETLMRAHVLEEFESHGHRRDRQLLGSRHAKLNALTLNHMKYSMRKWPHFEQGSFRKKGNQERYCEDCLKSSPKALGLSTSHAVLVNVQFPSPLDPRYR